MVQAQTELSVGKRINKAGLFSSQPVQGVLQVSVIVPVRNEAAHLIDTLDALRNQQDACGNPLQASTYEVLVLANNCTDHSENIVYKYQKEHPYFPLHLESIRLPPPKANIGVVRRMLMDAACRRLHESGNPNGIIASTDGDTIVDRHWIHHIIREIANGNDAVGGRILTKMNHSPGRLYHLRDVMYRSLLARAEAIIDPCVNDPWPGHFQYFGASLAVTCDMYERAGRLPQVPYLEDSAFLKALNSIDAKVRKSNHVKVYTSTRMQGRVAVGFSEQLKIWNKLSAAATVQLVEPAEASLIKLKNRSALRASRNNYLQNGYCGSELITIARSLFISTTWLKKQLENSNYFGALWQQVEQKMDTGAWSKMWKPVPVTKTIEELRLFVSKATVRLL